MSVPKTNVQLSAVEVWRGRLKSSATRGLINPIVSVLRTLHVTPNQITWAGLLGGAGAGVLLGYGHFFWGGVAVLLGSALDMLDGALARSTGKASQYGAFLDSVIDRVSEAVILLGLLLFFARAGKVEETVLIFLGFTASVMVSYVKARAEGLGLSCNVGFVTRPERIMILGVGLLLPWLTAALYILTILSFWTALHRFVHAGRQASKPSP